MEQLKLNILLRHPVKKKTWDKPLEKLHFKRKEKPDLPKQEPIKKQKYIVQGKNHDYLNQYLNIPGVVR